LNRALQTFSLNHSFVWLCFIIKSGKMKHYVICFVSQGKSRKVIQCDLIVVIVFKNSTLVISFLIFGKLFLHF
jgi:hypothetical protein